jgi:hypothetical protein
MKGILALCLIMWSGLAVAFPVTDYDYHTADRALSPITSGLGGLNLTNPDDPAIFYGNPAAMALCESPMTSAVFSFQGEHTAQSLWDTSVLRQKKHLDLLALVSAKAAIAWIPYVDLHENYTITGDTEASSRRVYEDYSLQCWQAGFVSDKNDLHYGLTLKYLSGRLVYRETGMSELPVTEYTFIDDVARGYSSDLGVLYSPGNFRYALVVNDVFSKLYWQDNPNVRLQQHGAFAMQYGVDAARIMYGVQGKLDRDPDFTYHFGLEQKTLYGGTKVKPSYLSIRTGIWSHDFKNSDSVFASVGLGYSMGGLHFDASLAASGMKIANGRFLAGVTLGL